MLTGHTEYTLPEFPAAAPRAHMIELVALQIGCDK
jgi:hypothetical protein